jgi:hypothetical protein
MKKDFSRDFKDIAYFIDHVQHLDARVDVLEKMGYKIGVDVVTKETDKVGKVIVGKRGELRIQITPAQKCFPLAKCVILENE